MRGIEVGQRVAVFAYSDDEEVALIGRGVYVGDEVPPVDLPGYAGAHALLGVKAPRIDLDGGHVCYGVEGWLVTESVFKELSEGKRIGQLGIDSHRLGAPSVEEVIELWTDQARAMHGRPDIPPAMLGAFDDAQDAAGRMRRPAVMLAVFEAHDWQQAECVDVRVFSSVPTSSDENLLRIGMRGFLDSFETSTTEEAMH